jgi:hypothetical protein
MESGLPFPSLCLGPFIADCAARVESAPEGSQNPVQYT